MSDNNWWREKEAEYYFRNMSEYGENQDVEDEVKELALCKDGVYRVAE